ncbi:MAG: sugar isomerase [Bacteroidia bacterium]|nr:sugar isomerase [Bacteroidia bacterium]
MKSILKTATILTISSLVVNGGNYLINLFLGKYLSISDFSDATLMITLLIGISFMATAFQLTSAKWSAENSAEGNIQVQSLNTLALILGVIMGGGMILFAGPLSGTFQITSPYYFYMMGFITPFYFLMSVGRGVLQGKGEWKKWMISYQVEMWSRLILTFIMVFAGFGTGGAVAGLGLSVIISWLFVPRAQFHSGFSITGTDSSIWVYFSGILIYELSQILINNGDILLVKSYFDGETAGKYAALGLIGRIVYFSSWSVANLLIGEVIREAKKSGKTTKMFIYSLVFTALTGGLIVLFVSLFSEQILSLWIGDNGISIAPLMGKYAIATVLFSLSNIIVYYNLAFGSKAPVFITLAAGVFQVMLISLNHTDLHSVILTQVFVQFCLLAVLSIRELYFTIYRQSCAFYSLKKSVYRKY